MKTGLSLSSVDKDIFTFDLRFKKPNNGDFLSNASMHTIEHLLATTLRNSEIKDKIIYFGPMGCRTGFYLLTRDVDLEKVKPILKDCIKICQNASEVYGAKKEECGNYLEHDLVQAKIDLMYFLELF